MNRKKIIFIVALVVFVFVAAVGAVLVNTSSAPGGSGVPDGSSPIPPGVACTMEAKLCPDGSYVGRQGPKCEFATCPGAGSASPSFNTPQSEPGTPRPW